MIGHPALHGILPVLQIPFRGASVEQVVDDDSLRAEVDFCIAAGVDGLVVPALASEFMVLAPEERRGVVATVIDQTGQRVPVVANVAAASLQEAVSYATQAREAGAAAVMALPPYVRRPGPDGVFAYYKAIAEAARLPTVIQNAPLPFGMNLPSALVNRLVDEIDRIAYVKEERLPPGHHMSDVLAGASSELLGVFGGTAGLYLPSELARGAIGCMPSAAIPDVLVDIYRAYADGDIARARAVHQQVLPLLSMEMSVLMAVSKEVLVRRGVFAGSGMRDPEFPALDGNDLAELDALWPGVSPLFSA
jgi:dihydrodipicolinate synthase/N-acetylneuraminate lyase